MIVLWLSLFFAASCTGYSLQGTRPNVTDIIETNTSSTLHYDWLCSRTHSNTAFVGVQPYSKQLLFSPGDCFKSCIESYPRCVAVVFYNLHEGDLNNVCYTFDKNSVNEDVALVPERPQNSMDVIRALEIVPDCHIFDPVPPLQEEYVSSTDSVTQSRRVMLGSQSPVRPNGAWSAWTLCSPRAPTQIRSQPCDYGRLINRRKCAYGSMYPSYRTAVIVNANIPYPPMPYVHPECHTREYDQIMSHHVDQMRKICCVRPEYQPKPETRETYQPPPAFVPSCRQVCVQPPPQETQTIDIRDEDSGITELETSIIPTPPPEWQQWTEWSVCSQTCGTGTEQRHRTCSSDGCIGKALEQRRCLELEPCETWADWTPWSNCRATCGMGQRTRSRYCHLGTGGCYGEDFQVDDCDTVPCPEWNPWEAWSACSATCGHGSKYRSRTCTGAYCPGSAHEQIDCELTECSAWAPWQEWSACSASCEMGTQERRRICIGSNCDGPEVEEKNCLMAPCAMWLEWSPWSSCSVSCGWGVTIRERSCYAEGCTGEWRDVKNCKEMDCSMWGEWQDWSFCSATCDSGMKTRKRVCYGLDCIGESEQTETCMNQPCSQWQEWQDWSPCSVTCGYGVQTRVRECNGHFCPGNRIEEISCPLQPCSTWSNWHEWSTCSVSCGNGQQYRIRQCLNGNDCVGIAEDIRHCTGSLACASWSPWGEWNECSRECGPGEKARRRECLTPDRYITESCQGPATESALCNERPCCEWSPWGAWSACDRMCGGGRMSRMRDCQRPGTHANGTCYCPGNGIDSISCNSEPCPLPSQTTIRRGSLNSRKDVRIDTQTVVPCLSYENCQQPIYQQPIVQPQQPITNGTNCHWTQWCQWSSCPSSCNYGMTRRHRYCIGDQSCLCNGQALEKMNCAASEQCRKRK